MIEESPIEPVENLLNEGSDQEGYDLEDDESIKISLKVETHMKSKLEKFEEMCKTETMKLKLVYILCYKETDKLPSFALRLRDAASGDNGQPSLLHSLSTSDHVGQLKIKIFDRLKQVRQHIGDHYRHSDGWASRLIAGPAWKKDYIDRVVVEEVGGAERSLADPGPEKYFEEIRLGDHVTDGVIVKDISHPIRKLNDLLDRVIKDIRHIMPIYESLKVSNRETAKEMIWGPDIKNERKKDIVHHLYHAAVLAISHNIAEHLLNTGVGDSYDAANLTPQKRPVAAEGVLSPHSKQKRGRRQTILSSSSSESNVPIQSTSSTSTASSSSNLAILEREMEELLHEQSCTATSLHDLFKDHQAGHIDDLSFENLKITYNNTLKRIQDHVNSLSSRIQASKAQLDA